MLRQKSWIDEANERVNIADVLTSIGVFVPDSGPNGGNKKVYCPFGFYHSDGGITKAMKIFPKSNNVYCFSCSKRYSPVGLASAAWDCSWTNAAFKLLEDSGFKPKTLEERWVEATTPLDNKPDLISLADALKMFCSGICEGWSVKQLDDDVAETLNKCLGLLNLVTTDEDAAKWLHCCKKVMTRLLEEI